MMIFIYNGKYIILIFCFLYLWNHFFCIGLCTGQESSCAQDLGPSIWGMVSSTLGPKVGHGLDPISLISPMENN